MTTSRSGLFVCEGSSDEPLADIVETLFLERGVTVRLTAFKPRELGRRVGRDVASQLGAAQALLGRGPDVVVVHRDADGAGHEARREEIAQAARGALRSSPCVPVVPVRMTEAWLLLDAGEIRRAAGNPNGRARMPLPAPRNVETVADPKEVLRQCLLCAAGVTGRRRERLARRFPESRRLLLQRLDPHGPVTSLRAWQVLCADIERAASDLR